MIRAALPRDAADIAALWNWMIRETLATFTTIEKTEDDIIRMIADRQDAFWVDEISGGISGFATFGPFRAGPGYAATAEHTIIIDPSQHGRGVGRALMGHVETRASAQGIHTLIGAVSGANPQAIAFHSAIGYREAGRILQAGRKADTFLDLVLMQKIMTGELPR